MGQLKGKKDDRRCVNGIPLNWPGFNPAYLKQQIPASYFPSTAGVNPQQPQQQKKVALGDEVNHALWEICRVYEILIRALAVAACTTVCTVFANYNAPRYFAWDLFVGFVHTLLVLFSHQKRWNYILAGVHVLTVYQVTFRRMFWESPGSFVYALANFDSLPWMVMDGIRTLASSALSLLVSGNIVGSLFDNLSVPSSLDEASSIWLETYAPLWFQKSWRGRPAFALRVICAWSAFMHGFVLPWLCLSGLTAPHPFSTTFNVYCRENAQRQVNNPNPPNPPLPRARANNNQNANVGGIAAQAFNHVTLFTGTLVEVGARAFACGHFAWMVYIAAPKVSAYLNAMACGDPAHLLYVCLPGVTDTPGVFSPDLRVWENATYSHENSFDYTIRAPLQEYSTVCTAMGWFLDAVHVLLYVFWHVMLDVEWTGEALMCHLWTALMQAVFVFGPWYFVTQVPHVDKLSLGSMLGNWYRPDWYRAGAAAGAGGIWTWLRHFAPNNRPFLMVMSILFVHACIVGPDQWLQLYAKGSAPAAVLSVVCTILMVLNADAFTWLYNVCCNIVVAFAPQVMLGWVMTPQQMHAHLFQMNQLQQAGVGFVAQMLAPPPPPPPPAAPVAHAAAPAAATAAAVQKEKEKEAERLLRKSRNLHAVYPWLWPAMRTIVRAFLEMFVGRNQGIRTGSEDLAWIMLGVPVVICVVARSGHPRDYLDAMVCMLQLHLMIETYKADAYRYVSIRQPQDVPYYKPMQNTLDFVMYWMHAWFDNPNA